MSIKHSEGCLRAAAEIIGNKWTPIIIDALESGYDLKFCQLEHYAEGISPRTLSLKLKKLEDYGIINRQTMKNSSRFAYSLTDKGRDLLPILRDMRKWGSKHISADSQNTGI